MGPKAVDGMTNSVDPDQTAPEQSDLGLHCLSRPVCPRTLRYTCYLESVTSWIV